MPQKDVPLLIFVSGPYRSSTVAGIEKNIRRAQRLAERVWQLGCVAVCPHLNSRLLDGLVPDEWILEGYLEVLSRCDAMILTPKWKESAGARAEVQHALKVDIPIFSEISALSQWLDGIEDDANY